MRLLQVVVLLMPVLAGGCPAPESVERESAGTGRQSNADSVRRVVAVSDGGVQVDVRPLDTAGNPYAGGYSELDRWVWEHYDPGEEFPANWPKLLPEGFAQRALLVTDDGWAVPGLEYLRFELERRKNDQSPGERPAGNVLYAIGPLDDSLSSASLQQRFRLIAEYMPPVPAWLAASPPCWALLLPDGSVVTRGEPGAGMDYYPARDEIRQLKTMKAFHYSSDGELLRTGEQGRVWCELFFGDFEKALERHEVSRESVRQTGWYAVFMNLVERSKTGYYFYDGTPLSAEEAAGEPDLNNLFEMYGRFIPDMYSAQQDLAGEKDEVDG